MLAITLHTKSKSSCMTSITSQCCGLVLIFNLLAFFKSSSIACSKFV